MPVVPYLRRLNLRLSLRYTAVLLSRRSSQAPSCKTPSLCCPRRQYASEASTDARTVVGLESSVEKDLSENVYRPKKHPGSTKVRSAALPDRFREAASVILRDKPVSQLLSQTLEFSNYLWSRRPPPEDFEQRELATELEQDLTIKELRKQKAEELNSGSMENIRQQVLRKLRARTYHWQAVEYDDNKSLVYLLARAGSEYAALVKIFTEIQQRVPEFRPSALLDFGSGVGTAFWATLNVWDKSLKEYFAVDSSVSMNELARLLVQDGQPNHMPILKNTFFRQFLPASHTLDYSLVVSAYSLLELPNVTTRLKTLSNLWSKTEQFLVIVELGTNAGHKMVVEARDFILKTSDVDVYVFSPCSHDLICPRLTFDKTPCNFDVGCWPLVSKSQTEPIQNEKYSYVVLRKGRRAKSELWPRIIREVLPRSKHVICRMCCSDGQLKEAVFTAKKSGKLLYKCARASRWGDRLPVVDVEIAADVAEPRTDADNGTLTNDQANVQQQKNETT